MYIPFRNTETQLMMNNRKYISTHSLTGEGSRRIETAAVAGLCPNVCTYEVGRPSIDRQLRKRKICSDET